MRERRIDVLVSGGKKHPEYRRGLSGSAIVCAWQKRFTFSPWIVSECECFRAREANAKLSNMSR